MERLRGMEHYCIKTRKETRWYFDRECKKRDFLYEYHMTGKMPLFIQLIQGRLGKQFLVKHYRTRRLKNGKRLKKRILMTKFPDMSGIVASEGQRACRDLFKEAVAFGKVVIADADLKMRWRQRYRLANCQVFNKAIKLYLLYLRKGELIEEELRPAGWEVFIRKAEEKPMVVQKEVNDVIEEVKEVEMNKDLVKVGIIITSEALRLAG